MHQARRKLINFTQQLVDKLEAKVISPSTASTAEAIVPTSSKPTDTSQEPTADNTNLLPASSNNASENENISRIKEENQKIETQNNSSDTAEVVLNIASVETPTNPEKSNEPEIKAPKTVEQIVEPAVNPTTVHSLPQ